MLRRITLCLFAAAPIALFSSAMAQTAAPAMLHSAPPDNFRYMPAQQVLALTGQTSAGPHTAYLGDHENSYVEYATRSDSGNVAEVHAHWTHYIHVLEGEAKLTYGGTVVNAKDTGPGQVRGDSISGGTTITVHPGDFIQIPAGTPHLFNPAAGAKFHYVVFNARQ